MCRIAEKLNIQNYVYSKEHYVNNICTKCLDLQIKLNVQNSVNSTENCAHQMYGMFGLAEKLIIQNCINSTGNSVHYICTEFLDLQKN